MTFIQTIRQATGKGTYQTITGMVAIQPLINHPPKQNQRCKKPLVEGRRFTDSDNARLAKRLRKQRLYLLRFLQVEGVEATNNRAERALRPAVIVRKTGGCNKTPRGARTHGVLASVLQTLKQQGLKVVDYLVSVLTASLEPPKILSPP